MPAQLPPALRGLPDGVYENSGIAVRIPPERVYEISRNQQLSRTAIVTASELADVGQFFRLAGRSRWGRNGGISR